MAIIYKITNTINNKVYVGKTLKSLEQRFKEHCDEAKRWALTENHKYNSRLYPAMVKYGTNCFEPSILECCDESEINEKEKFWINELNTTQLGYNISPGGLGGPLYKNHHHSEATRKKLSENNYWKTHKQSQEYVNKRLKSRREKMKKIQCLNTGEIYRNHIELDLKYDGSSINALKNKGKFRGLFYVELPEDLPDGYSDIERLKLLEEYINRLKIIYKAAGVKSHQHMTEEKKEQRKIKLRKTLANKSPEELQQYRLKQSINSKHRYENLSDAERKQLSEDAKRRALKQHQQYSEEKKKQINEKISLSQKGKGYYKNIITNEIKLITPKHFAEYDLEKVWKKCHKDGSFWES